MLFLQAVLNLLLFTKHSRSTNSNPLIPEFTQAESNGVLLMTGLYANWFKRIRAKLQRRDYHNKSQIEEAIKELEELIPADHANYQESSASKALFESLMLTGTENILINYPEYVEALNSAEEKLAGLCKSVGIKGLKKYSKDLYADIYALF